MTVPYVLILVITLHQGGLAMQEFTSEKSCLAALETVKADHTYGTARGYCVPK